METGLSADKSARNPVVTILRGVAVFWVVSYHLQQLSWLDARFLLLGYPINLNFLPATGYYAAELFIFISGFGLFYRFARLYLNRHPLPGWAAFYRRRALRILPLYLITVIGSLFWDYAPAAAPRRLVAALLSQLTFTHHLFRGTFDALFGTLWILGVIVQFYLVFPLLCRAFLRHPFLTFALCACLALGYRLMMVRFWVESGFFYLNQLPGFLDLFLWGMAAAYLFLLLSRYQKKLASYGGYFSLTALFLLCLFLLMLNDADRQRYLPSAIFHWQASNRFIFGLLCCCFTLSASFAGRVFTRCWHNRVFSWLAGVSFPLFLSHRVIGEGLLKAGWIPHSGEGPRGGAVWQAGFSLCVWSLSLLTALIATCAFQRPLVRFFKRQKPPL